MPKIKIAYDKAPLKKGDKGPFIYHGQLYASYDDLVKAAGTDRLAYTGYRYEDVSEDDPRYLELNKVVLEPVEVIGNRTFKPGMVVPTASAEDLKLEAITDFDNIVFTGGELQGREVPTEFSSDGKTSFERALSGKRDPRGAEEYRANLEAIGMNPIFGNTRVQNSHNAWAKNPEFMLGWTNALTLASATLLSPYAIPTAVEAAPAVSNWLMNTGMPWVAKYIAAPTAAGMTWDLTLKALTGTTTTEQISNYLQLKGWNPVISEMVGGTSNPGYWINFGGVGKYTRPLFNKIGLGLSNPSAPIELSPTILANINASMPKSKFLTKVVEPVTNFYNTVRLSRALNKNIDNRRTLYSVEGVPLERGFLYHTSTGNPKLKVSDKGVQVLENYPSGSLLMENGKYVSARSAEHPDRIWWDKQGHNIGDKVYVMRESSMPSYELADPNSYARPGGGAYSVNYRTTEPPSVNNIVRFELDKPLGTYRAYSPYRSITTNRMSLEQLFTPEKLEQRPVVPYIDFNRTTSVKNKNIPSWSLNQLPGYLIKSLMSGSPLEKQLSKNGTLSLKLLLAYVNRNDVSAVDKEMLNRVLLNHANDTHIDYNTLRLEVLGMIPKYNRVPLTEYEEYGIRSLGYKTTDDKNAENIIFNDLTEDFEIDPNIPDNTSPLEFTPYTFTFESPGIKGNTRHYQGNPIGHSRTYTTVEEPDILYIMESLSDWALNPKEFHERRNRINEIVNNFKNARLNQNTLGYSEDRFNELYTKALDDLFNSNIQSRMIDTYPIRQIQENLMYAAKLGLNKMRYPTPETAAKIEGYVKSEYTPEYRDLVTLLESITADESKLRALPDEIDLNTNTEVYYTPKLRELLIQDLNNRIADLKLALKDRTYPSEHLTILKKYADFPKQFLKLFGKKAEVRTVTDAKGNTWYEVDVPENYLNGTAEMLFRKGGKLNSIERFKRNRKYK